MSSSDLPTKTMTFNTYELEIIRDALTIYNYYYHLRKHSREEEYSTISLIREIEHFLLTLKETERS